MTQKMPKRAQSLCPVCLRRLEKGARLRPAIILFAQFLAAIGVIIVLEFTTFEKKIEMIEWLPADACHLIMIGLCIWIALAFRSLWKKAYIERSSI